MTGVIFVFTPALGEFVIPDLLGGARTMMIGNLITEQFLKTRDWPFGAALSCLLIGVVVGEPAALSPGARRWMSAGPDRTATAWRPACWRSCLLYVPLAALTAYSFLARDAVPETRSGRWTGIAA